MRRWVSLLAGFMLTGSMLVPLSASAAGFSFGGKVITVLPCSGGMLHVTIIPAGAFPVTYIWTPFTITKSVGPPLPGGQILGVADIPFVCFVGAGFLSLPVPLFGFRMQFIGTSPPGSAAPGLLF